MNPLKPLIHSAIDWRKENEYADTYLAVLVPYMVRFTHISLNDLDKPS